MCITPQLFYAELSSKIEVPYQLLLQATGVLCVLCPLPSIHHDGMITLSDSDQVSITSHQYLKLEK